MLLLIAVNGASFSPPPHVEVQSIARVRIERPAIANSKEWEQTPKASRREIILHDENGQPVLVRLIEYQ